MSAAPYTRVVITPMSEVAPALRRRDWHGWELDANVYALNLHRQDGSLRYQVDLEDCTDSAQVLDWIVQIAGKGWATPEVLAGLVYAIDDVLNVQATLCSFGKHLTIDPAKIRKLTRAAASRRH